MDGFSDKDLRDLRRLLQNAALQDYPNPERVGCPGARVLEQVASASVAFEHSAYSHVRVCAPCLREMLEMRQRKILHRQELSRNRLRGVLYAVGVIVVFVLVLGAVINRGRNDGFPRNSGSGTQPAIRQSSKSGLLLTANLSTLSRTRGSAATLPVLSIPSIVVDLRITLPFGSDDGRYEIEIRDASDRVTIKSAGIAEIKDGDTLLTLAGLDFSRIPAGRYELFFRHADASWQHVPVVIGGTHG